ncbi:MAG: type VI secretion system amidase effector protein Tae4 [Proteobacteria bacterium]|nr:type VI secretion system amidase effector protein Tae4 [Pseudomonadota bacterium]
MAQPNFKMMWDAFPDHSLYPNLRVLFTFIGGTLINNIDAAGFGENGNTCAVRMSRALNYGNLQISAKLVKTLKIATMTGSDSKLYIFRVNELKTYLINALGVTPITVTKDFGKAFLKKKGIVAFEVKGWTDASGHLALWNGSAFREPEHDDYRNLKDDPKTTKVVEPYTNKMTLWEL